MTLSLFDNLFHSLELSFLSLLKLKNKKKYYFKDINKVFVNLFNSNFRLRL